MIPIVEEPKEYFEETGFYEYCYFGCGNNTKFWHLRTNQPICIECAKNHKVSEVEKCTPSFKHKKARRWESLKS